jgi:hypothetical protein
MSKKWKRTEITIESETTMILRRNTGGIRVWCGLCGAESQMLTPDAAAGLAGVTTRAIYTRVERGALHFCELPDGTLLVCGPSLGLNQQ